MAQPELRLSQGLGKFETVVNFLKYENCEDPACVTQIELFATSLDILSSCDRKTTVAFPLIAAYLNQYARDTGIFYNVAEDGRMERSYKSLGRDRDTFLSLCELD